MKSIVTKQDMAFMEKIFKFTSPCSIPLSFQYRGEEIHGIPEAWHPTVERQLTDSSLTSFIIRGRSADGLEVKVEVKEYRDYPMIEYTAFFTNTGDIDTGIVSDIRIAEGVIEGENPILIHGNGDTRNEDGYEWWHEPVSSISLSPTGGTSCAEAFPYMRLMFDGFGVNIVWVGPAHGLRNLTVMQRALLSASVSVGVIL